MSDVHPNVKRYIDGTETAEEVKDFELIDIIIKNRADLFILLNSDGGNVFEGEVILEMMKEVQKQGGKTTTYMGHRCGSAAARIFLAGDVRYSLATGEFMEHISSTTIRGIFPLLKDALTRGPRIKSLEQRLMAKSSDPARIAELVKEAARHHPEVEVRLTADELEELGILTGKFDAINDMVAHVSTSTGLIIDPKKPFLDAEYFFALLACEKIVTEVCGSKVAIKREPNGTAELIANKDSFELVERTLKEIGFIK